VLEDFLNEFEGVLLIVSHDRYFMDKLTDHMFVFEGEGVITDFNGNYTDYRLMLQEKERLKRQGNKAGQAAVSAAPVMEKRKLTYKENMELESLPGLIESLENEKSRLESEMSSGSLTHEQITEAARKFEELTGQIEERTMRWLDLEDNK
jgi:ATP-binding cassette subfamily F protein uup